LIALASSGRLDLAPSINGHIRWLQPRRLSSASIRRIGDPIRPYPGRRAYENSHFARATRKIDAVAPP
jgi:hypothetical protein